MALMFSRLANNFAKNGYYPTDALTLSRIFQAIGVENSGLPGALNILDTCCGEGVALAELANHLREQGLTVPVASYGVEYDAERAWHAKQLLDTVAHADYNDMAIKPRQFGCLFLNPPYGDLVADQGSLSERHKGRKRFEKEFYKRSHPWLGFEGLLILIVPHYALDVELSDMIARQYREVRVFMASEQQFKQCVVLGIKRRSDRPNPELARQLEAIGQGQLPPELPEHWSENLYNIPATAHSPSFVAMRMTLREFEAEMAKPGISTLWPQFEHVLAGRVLKHRPPLRALGQWHLALALAAGQVQGIVTSKLGRRLLVKGDTFKDKTVKVTHEDVGNKAGDIRQIQVRTDRFVPQIRAFDLTPGSAMYGHLVTIQ